jgi:hypothetical protein
MLAGYMLLDAGIAARLDTQAIAVAPNANSHVSRPISEAALTVKGSASTSTISGNGREPTRNNGQTARLQNIEWTAPFMSRISAMSSGYYRTSRPVTALPMIMR